MNKDLSTIKVLKALGNEKRWLILQWILDPTNNFPPQEDGDLVEDGVCIGYITLKIKLSQPTVTEHMKVLSEAGLVTSKQIKNWVFYKPDKIKIKNSISKIGNKLNV